MIPLEGRVLAGLDEFMLRLGHLKVLAGVAADVGGSWGRIEREYGRYITELVPVPPDLVPRITEYVAQKRLCPSTGEGTSEADRDYRYPDLMLREDDSGKRELITDQSEITVWRQDLWMASPEVPSKVGAVTVSAKSGSKTGASHIRDWATLIELFTTSGQLAPEGHLAIKLNREVEGDVWRTNPYAIGRERLIFAYLLLSADIDLFVRLAPKLLRATFPLRKTNAVGLFSDTVSALSDEAEEARSLGSSRQFRLLQQLRELQGQRRSGGTKASTTWHRAASRFETYVELGFLEKGEGGELERYEYTYYPGAALERCVDSLERASSAEQWIDDFMVSAVFDVEASSAQLASDDVESILRVLAPCLGRPISLLPIAALALGISCLTAEQARAVTFRAARESIEDFARTRPELARLSRGGSGSRAEFVSLLMKVERG